MTAKSDEQHQALLACSEELAVLRAASEAAHRARTTCKFKIHDVVRGTDHLGVVHEMEVFAIQVRINSGVVYEFKGDSPGLILTYPEDALELVSDSTTNPDAASSRAAERAKLEQWLDQIFFSRGVFPRQMRNGFNGSVLPWVTPWWDELRAGIITSLPVHVAPLRAANDEFAELLDVLYRKDEREALSREHLELALHKLSESDPLAAAQLVDTISEQRAALPRPPTTRPQGDYT